MLFSSYSIHGIYTVLICIFIIHNEKIIIVMPKKTYSHEGVEVCEQTE